MARRRRSCHPAFSRLQRQRKQRGTTALPRRSPSKTHVCQACSALSSLFSPSFAVLHRCFGKRALRSPCNRSVFGLTGSNAFGRRPILLLTLSCCHYQINYHICQASISLLNMIFSVSTARQFGDLTDSDHVARDINGAASRDRLMKLYSKSTNPAVAVMRSMVVRMSHSASEEVLSNQYSSREVNVRHSRGQYREAGRQPQFGLP